MDDPGRGPARRHVARVGRMVQAEVGPVGEAIGSLGAVVVVINEVINECLRLGRACFQRVIWSY